jgi:thymidylate synthase (FAD)
MKIELLNITENAEQLIELVGRTAYQSQDRITDDSAKIFIERLIKMGHTSVLEHATTTFKISGISRVTSHQLVRHRLASFTQKSQRYVKSNNFDYIIPHSIKNDGRALNIFLNMMEKLNESYYELQILGIKNEDARFILPEATETEVIMTANFREWRHIIQLRTDKSAQWEIRAICNEILEILKEEAPSCFGDL